jgi:predicted TIM-barrel fold metal-dependent hydrolase
MGEKLIIDGHIHCSPTKIEINGEELWNPIERVKKELGEIGVGGAVLLPFAEDIYRTPYATEESPQIAHDYIIEVSKENEYFFPFYFVWNDFAIPDNMDQFKGIKWHRHDFSGFLPSEPEYDYSDPKCDKFVEAIRHYDLPVIFEESFENTKLFCNKYPDIKVIIPHVGSSNDRIGGGRRVISEFKDYPNVYVGTSIAIPSTIVSAVLKFGAGRVIFGSDMPYSSTKIELSKLLEFDLNKYIKEADIDRILSKNILKLMKIEV